MRQAVVTHNVVKMHAEPDPDSEQVSQTLLGHLLQVSTTKKAWAEVITDDGYSGWVRTKQIRLLEENEVYPKAGHAYRVRALWSFVYEHPAPDAAHLTIAPLGAWLEGTTWMESWLQIRLPDGREGWVSAQDVTEQWVWISRAGALRVEGTMVTRGKTSEPYVVPRTGWQNALVYTAKRLLGVPYLWGGSSPFGLDCSGFVQLVYRMCGLVLPRDADLQARFARTVNVALQAIQPGDLIFFAGEDDPHYRDITHVGIILDNTSFIHSAGGIGVTITPLDDPQYSAILWGVRRVLDLPLSPS